MFYSPHKAGQIHQVQIPWSQTYGEILHWKRTPGKYWVKLFQSRFEVQIYPHLNPVIPTVRNNNVALVVDSDPVGPGELPILCAF